MPTQWQLHRLFAIARLEHSAGSAMDIVTALGRSQMNIAHTVEHYCSLFLLCHIDDNQEYASSGVAALACVISSRSVNLVSGVVQRSIVKQSRQAIYFKPCLVAWVSLVP